MTIRFLSAVLAASFTFAGCAASSEPVDEPGESTSEALSSHELVGAYRLAPGFTGDFTYLVLKANGTYFSETQIVCITTPCINPRAEGKWTSSAFSATKSQGTLTLDPKGPGHTRYYVSLAGDRTSMKLAHSATESASLYERIGTFCDSIKDCAGQPVPAMRYMCMIGSTMQTFCEANSCVTKCAPKAECTVDADCRLFDDYCTGCDCRALSTSAANPVCSGPGVRCLRQPCGGRTAACDAGKCTVR